MASRRRVNNQANDMVNQWNFCEQTLKLCVKLNCSVVFLRTLAQSNDATQQAHKTQRQEKNVYQISVGIIPHPEIEIGG